MLIGREASWHVDGASGRWRVAASKAAGIHAGPARHPANSCVRESVLSRLQRGLRSRVQKTAENDTCERDVESVRDYPELEINIFESAKIKNHALFFQRIERFFRNKFPYRLRNIVVDGNKKADHERNNTGAVATLQAESRLPDMNTLARVFEALSTPTEGLFFSKASALSDLFFFHASG
jgi:hypothetical protein